MIPTTSYSPVVKRETEATKDTVHPTNNGSTEDVQPSVVLTESLILNSKPVISLIIEHVASPLVDALILMPKFGPSIKSLLTNKDKLCEFARTPLNEHCSAVLLQKLPEKLGDPGKFLIPCDFPEMTECLALADLGASINLMTLCVWNKPSLPDLSPTCMTLELADCSISRPVGVAEDVFVKVGTFYFPTDFVVVDFDADSRVPLILGRSFLKTGRALIDVFEANYNDMTANRIDVIDMASEEYSQEVLGFLIDFLLKEVDAFLAIEDDPTSPEVNQSYLDTEGDILLLEAFLNEIHHYPLPNQGNYLPEVRKELKICEAEYDKSSIDEPPKEDFEPAVQHQRRINPKIHDVIKQEVLKLLDARFIKDFTKIARPMTRLLEKDTLFLFSKECVEAFQTFKRKLTEAPILIALDWDMPFELMCDASDFAIGAVLGKRQEKHFRPIHYASKTTTEAESNYTIAEKEMLAVKDSKARLLRWVLLLQEFTFKVIDTKGAENLAADHLSRLENPHQNVLDPKEINESFPSETLNMVSTRGNSSTPWRVGKNRASWSDKLDDALWAFRTAYKTPIGCTPYKLVYGKAGHLPIELEHKTYCALKHPNFDLRTAGDYIKVQLNELCDQAYKNSLIYKEKTKRLNDSKIKDRVFNTGDRVLLFYSRLKIFSSKLKYRWSGPFNISHVFSYGTVELSQPDGPNFKVNGHRLKHYFGEDVQKLVVPDLQTFPRTIEF
nr:DNA-directed DNA polymerase [Tanacetum cinerariifolium]